MVFALFPILFIGAATADEKHCSLVQDNAERKNCYSQQPATQAKDWLVAESNYFNSVTVSNSAVHEVMCGDVVGSISLVLVCAKDKTSVVLSTSCVMGKKNDRIDAEFQIDDGLPQREKFVVPNNKRALQADGETNSIRIAKTLFLGDALHITLSPPAHAVFTATFNIKNIESKLEPLRDACGW